MELTSVSLYFKSLLYRSISVLVVVLSHRCFLLQSQTFAICILHEYLLPISLVSTFISNFVVTFNTKKKNLSTNTAKLSNAFMLAHEYYYENGMRIANAQEEMHNQFLR
jgi:hypothetical protein